MGLAWFFDIRSQRSLWPNDDYITTPEATKSITWTNWPLFTVGLVQRGYSDDDIRKIIGGNVLRVARETLKSAQGRLAGNNSTYNIHRLRFEINVVRWFRC